MERRVEVPLENVGRANPSRFHILFRVEPYVGFFARRERQAETNLHVGGPMTFGFLLTHTPGEGLCAHHLEPLWEHLDRRFVLQDTRVRIQQNENWLWAFPGAPRERARA